MAKLENKRIVHVNAMTVATFQGVFAAVIGLGVAVLHSLKATVNVAQSTDSVLTGMAFGLAAGVVSIIVVPLLYFALGWVVGLVQGWLYNVVLGGSGGVVVQLEDEK